MGNVDLSRLRWTVDESEDFELVSRIYGELYPSGGISRREIS
jgi:spore coat polysaccharide biosynthesis protein SpsF (cytidylyltransferase family)